MFTVRVTSQGKDAFRIHRGLSSVGVESAGSHILYSQQHPLFHAAGGRRGNLDVGCIVSRGGTGAFGVYEVSVPQSLTRASSLAQLAEGERLPTHIFCNC